ncbi:MAG: hypothetical protein IIC67_10975 [Thaumarchaeota archaeon]|nr:hypothetical protein [Nitrososphaerota archaeon]
MPNFHEILDEMKSAYFGTEHQFIEVSRVISVDNNPDTFSPQLYSILGDACNQVENLLRLLCDKLEIPIESNERKFPGYYRKLNETGIVQRQFVDLLIGKTAYSPFQILGGDITPKWWAAYNKTKHDLPQGYKKGNLGNTITALSGAYSLHCMFAYAMDYGRNILKNEWWHELEGISINTQSEFPVSDDNPSGSYIPKSKIFKCISYFQDMSLGAPM